MVQEKEDLFQGKGVSDENMKKKSNKKKKSRE